MRILKSILEHASLFGNYRSEVWKVAGMQVFGKSWAMFTELFQTQYLLLMEDGL